MAILVLPLAALFRRTAGPVFTDAARPVIAAEPVETLPPREAAPEWTLRQAMRTPHFWLLSLVYFCTGAGSFFVSLHQLAFAVDHGFDELYAAGVLGMGSFLAIPGIIVTGTMSDYIGREWSAVIAYGCSIIGVVFALFITGPGDHLLLWLHACFFGLTWGARGPAITAKTADLFPGRHLGAVLGVITVGTGLGSAIGSWGAGLNLRCLRQLPSGVPVLDCVIPHRHCGVPGAAPATAAARIARADKVRRHVYLQEAPGGPGIAPRWTSSDKDGVGTALSPLSRVWFTLSHGILNEMYYPRVDQACTRDFGLLVTDGEGFFSEEKRDTVHELRRLEDGVPAFQLTNTCIHGRYRIVKRIISDPDRDVVLQHVRFEPLDGSKLRLFALLAPHLVNGGAHNTGWTGAYKGAPMLFAEGDGTSLALAASVPWLARSVGFAGVNDGWQQLNHGFRLSEIYERASDGNVALTGELDWAAGNGDILLALGFGRYWSEAALRAKLSLADGFIPVARKYVVAWKEYQSPLLPLDRKAATGHNSYRVSTAVLRAHESPSFPGGLIASLSIPWGFSKSDDDLGGYHLVWPRDLVQTGGALVACGAGKEATRVLHYLRAIQDEDGGWPQNTWLDGVPYWSGVQLDECAFPILLTDLARRNYLLDATVLASFWPMVRRAAHFLMRNGPVTGQDRWEEDAGFSTFTLAVSISALLAGAELAEMHDAPADAALMRDTADAWNAALDEWTFATGTDLASRAGARGYYVRISPPEGIGGMLIIKNKRAEDAFREAAEVASPDALALVRFGLRAADDPRILDTVKVIDAALRIELPAGSCWYRYNGDGYGEHRDGRPFDGTGIGRPWPLLTGERAHYELAAGRRQEAERLLATMEEFAGAGGLLPEQVWDSTDIPSRELFYGQPSGSAMPLVWAHSEHIKLLRSLHDGAVFDMPPQTVQRYLRDKVAPRVAVWRPDVPVSALPHGRILRLDLPAPALVRWTADDWTAIADVQTTDPGVGGLHIAELPTATLAAGARIAFTWQLHDGTWAGRNYEVSVE